MPKPKGGTGTRTRTRKRPCTICRRWFQTEPQVVVRQRCCKNPVCRVTLRRKTQTGWRNRNPEYAATRRLDQRANQINPPAEPLRIPAPLDKLPWDLAKDEFSPQGIDFIALTSTLILRAAKDEIRSYLIDPTRLPGTLPPLTQKTRSNHPHTEPRAPGVSPTRLPLVQSAGLRTTPPTPPAGLSG
jgi:hypothetical protein